MGDIMIKLTFEGKSHAEISNSVAEYYKEINMAVEAEVEKTAKKKKKKKKSQPVLSSKTKADVQKAMQKLIEVKNIEATREVLTSFGYLKFSEIPEEKYDDVVAACEAKIEEADGEEAEV